MQGMGIGEIIPFPISKTYFGILESNEHTVSKEVF